MISVGAHYNNRPTNRPAKIKNFLDSAANEAVKTSSETGDIWRWLSKRYNVRNASREDMKSIAKLLHDAGEISVTEHAQLSLDETQAPFGRTTLTAAPEKEKLDWIEEFQARINFQINQHKPTTLEERIKAILQRLVTGPLEIFA